MNLKFRKEWLIEKAKRNWFWIFSTILVLAGLIFTPMFINENKNAIDEAAKAFQNKPLKSDNNIQGISIFLPQGFIIETEEATNFVVKKGSQRYLIYVNRLEKKTSKQVYQNVLNTGAHFTINETFKDGYRFGFLLAEKTDDKIELTVGVGGFKMTTMTTRSNMAADARNMMRIINSIKIVETK